jgi:predicted aconitase
MSAGLYLRNLSRIFHAVGITPEAATIEQALGNKKPLDVIDFGNKELENTMAMLNTEASRDVSWVVIGCPHCSLTELSEIAQYMDGKKVNHNVDLWILTSHAVKTMAERMGVIAAIEKSGGRILTDTCPDVITGKTLRALGHSSITTTSTVFAHSLGEYAAPHLFDNHVHHGSMKRCLDAAVSGTWRENG